ncbi:LpqB family beta-propeller domain-containing protein [Actinoplanes siamensis]|uniref:Lipoprotein LpqB n=1 Tax=Actinoplanes siamensis TaxID=1223317 RepID=A0A919NA35_9ACTN|nr:LpqB family beta-propeller domain-containing protein [Actinoplanes siamensis]GIF07143.1 lipoprotein LpqB [Actinoplanes siamensis]
MRRRSSAIALPAVVALVAMLTGACGIPDDTGVTVAGPGPSTGTSSNDAHGGTEVTRESASIDPVLFVQNYYLKAAAGDLDSAAARLRKFMTKEAARQFKPSGNELSVIRLVDKPLNTPGSDVVELTYERVGTLDKFGLLEPATETRQDTYKIKVGHVAGENGLFVTEAPPALLIDDRALNDFYEEQTIYFWNTDYTWLVPDVRYMPLAVPTEQRPTTVLNWLVNGPAPWLSVSDLADGTTLIGKVVEVSDNKYRITLSTQALPATETAEALDRLRRQLQWSLRPLLPDAELVLTVGHQDAGSYSDEDYLNSNRVARMPAEPEQFVVYGGRIRRLSETPSAVSQPPVLEPEENKGIRSAAMSASVTHNFAAVVSHGKADSLRVAAAPTGSRAALQPVGDLPGTLGEPAWAITRNGSAGGAIGLITGGGKLYSFAPGKGAAHQIPWTGQGTNITAVAVAPDGRRVALVVDGKLYRAALNTSGDTPSLGTPQQIRPADLRSVSAVGFNSEGWLTVAGVRSADKRVTIVDVSIDGALQSGRLSDLGDKPVDSLSVYPANPMESNPSSGRAYTRFVSYSFDGKAWEALSRPTLIGVDRLAGPNPSGSPAGNTVPTAPFYLD